MGYDLHTNDTLTRPVLHLLQARAGILDKRRVHIDESEEEDQRLGKQQQLNGQTYLTKVGQSSYYNGNS